jgi:hypothetical protein
LGVFMIYEVSRLPSRHRTHLAAERDAERLVPEAHAQDGDGVLAEQLEREADVLESERDMLTRSSPLGGRAGRDRGEDHAVRVGDDLAAKCWPWDRQLRDGRITARTYQSYLSALMTTTLRRTSLSE